MRALRRWPEAEFVKAGAASWQDVAAVHGPEYIQFLRAVDKQKIYPSVWGVIPPDWRSADLTRMAGAFVSDVYTPVSKEATTAAVAAAGVALVGAGLVAVGEQVAYALCRPPGHHAGIARAGGYCYLNNAALAANKLSRTGRVAIFDFDFHHGNGTQEIFYGRNDVLYVSIHAQTPEAFPHFSGFAQERGQGQGKGYNFNFPVAATVTDAQYAKVLARAMAKIRHFKPDYLVVSAGFDLHKDDPIGGMRITERTIATLGSAVATLGLPTLVVQEGGYNTATLGNLALTFLRQLEP